MQIVGSETIVCTTPDGSKIRTISMTFGYLSGKKPMSIHSAALLNPATEALFMYNRLQDIVRGWTTLSTKNISEYEIKKEWYELLRVILNCVRPISEYHSTAGNPESWSSGRNPKLPGNHFIESLWLPRQIVPSKDL